jgi:acetolactate synthase I/II/III large subunit
MYVHEVVARTLADHGVDTVFGVLGDANLYLMDSFQRAAGGRYVAFANELGAVLAANGYAQAGARLGVATVTSGPGLTNTVTGLVEGVRGHTPVLVIAGDTAAVDRENVQHLAQRELVAAAGAGFVQVRSPGTVAEDLAVAVRRAVLEQRPVVAGVPADFHWQEAECPPARPKFVAPQAVAPDPSALDEAAGAIAGANRPLVLAGRGATGPAARAALVRLAGRIGAPLGTTLPAKDLFRGEPHDLGIIGTLANDVALELTGQADCVIAFGAGLNKWTTADGSLLAKKRLVHVDLDRAAISRWAPADVGVVGDAAVVAETLAARLGEADLPASGFASDGLARRLASWPEYADRGTGHALDIRTALIRLDAAFPADRTLAFDGGWWGQFGFNLVHVPHPSACVHTSHFGSIGLGLGSAIGAALAVPDRPTLLVTGDGGFMLGGLAEFHTAVRLGLRLVVAVLNDGGYEAERVHLRGRGLDPALASFDWPDFAAVATSLGGRGHRIRTLDELDQALDDIAEPDRPVLLDIAVTQPPPGGGALIGRSR